MHHFLTSDNEYRDLIYDDDDRSHRIDQRSSPGDYRFGRTHRKHVWAHARAASSRVSGYLKRTIEAITNSKLRRMERELELHGIGRDRLDGSSVAPESRPTEHSRGLE
jgi:hypothetical protein